MLSTQNVQDIQDKIRQLEGIRAHLQTLPVDNTQKELLTAVQLLCTRYSGLSTQHKAVNKETQETQLSNQSSLFAPTSKIQNFIKQKNLLDQQFTKVQEQYQPYRPQSPVQR